MCVADSASPWLSPQERCATGSLGVFDACDGQDPFFQLAERLLGNAALVSPNLFKFGHLQIDASQVFYATSKSLAIVNLKPVVPGHCLVIPRRCTSRFCHLSAEEVSDLWTTAQKVGSVLENHFGNEIMLQHCGT
jgi:hypothetical protein